MDRRRAVGVGLILASAAGFGSGSLFAQPVYAAGVDWLVLSSWRFLFGAGLAWLWLIASPTRRAGLRALDRRAIVIALGLGVLYTGNSGTYYAGLETVSPGLACLIVFMYPVLVGIASLRVGRPLAGRRPWIALGLALVGVVLTIGGIDPANAPPVSGIILVITSTLIYARSAGGPAGRRAAMQSGESAAGAAARRRPF
jgi:drug/metabolite transporter (DMT)-like permease